jgi:sensor histidine kinase YesM
MKGIFMNPINHLRDKIKKAFINIRILPRLLITYFILIILPVFFIGLLLFFTSKHSIIDANQKSFVQTMNSISNDLGLLTSRVDDQTKLIANMLNGSTGNKGGNIEPAIMDSLSLIANSNTEFSYTIYTKSKAFPPIAPNCKVLDSSPYEGESWFKEALNSRENIYWLDSSYKSTNIGSEITGLRAISYGNETIIIGISVNLELLGSELNKIFSRYESTLYLVNAEGKKLYSIHSPTNSAQYAYPLSQELIKDIPLNGSGSIISKDAYRGEVMYNYIAFNQLKWRLISATPVKQFTSTIDDIWFWVCMILLFTTIFFVLISILLSQTLIRPVQQVIYSMRNPALDVSMNEFSGWKDEMGDLANAYTKRMEDVNALLSKIEESNEKKRLAQMEALQGQINFHFIYNTLNNIQWLAQANKKDEVIATVTALDKLLRACAYTTEDLITVEKELDYVESYLTAQKIRFGDIFTFEFDLDVLLLQMKIPKFVLQPIVENSIYHGLMNSKRENGLIRIKLCRRGHRIDITVYDNGVGINEDNINKILTNEHKSSGKSMGVALGNINKRIKLLFGKDYGLGINSKPGACTVIQLTIPIIP